MSDSSGDALAINAYDEYGVPSFGALANQRFGYAGMLWLDRAGLHQPTLRAYGQHLGRFDQTDPLGYGGDGPNLYAYVGNDPVNFVDPLGLVIGCVSVDGGPWSCHDFGGGAGGAIASVGAAFNIALEQLGLGSFGHGAAGGGGGGGGGDAPTKRKICGTGPRIKISPLGLGLTGFLLIGGFSGSVEGGVSIPLSALEGNFRGTQLYASGSITQLLGFGAFAGGGTNFGGGYTSDPLSTGTSISPVIQGGAAVMAGGEGQVELGSSPGVGGGAGPRVGYGGFVSGGIKRTATAATPELCY